MDLAESRRQSAEEAKKASELMAKMADDPTKHRFSAEGADGQLVEVADA